MSTLTFRDIVDSLDLRSQTSDYIVFFFSAVLNSASYSKLTLERFLYFTDVVTYIGFSK